VGGILDVPCGDLNWMSHAGAFKGGQVRYYGGDVSTVVLGEHQRTFGGDEVRKFGLVDVVDDDLFANANIRALYEGSGGGGGVLVVVRQLMQHLSTRECLRAIANLEALAAAAERDAGGRTYLMLTTYLRGDGNKEEDYLLALGHKVNLFTYPFCIRDPVGMVEDGVKDMFLGMWEVGGGAGGLLGERDDVRGQCVH
jgi:hypothetical protein